eukprot:scaffold9816_cov99-Skeletonema_dohrnii-CCMP3373.AAC.11
MALGLSLEKAKARAAKGTAGRQQPGIRRQQRLAMYAEARRHTQQLTVIGVTVSRLIYLFPTTEYYLIAHVTITSHFSLQSDTTDKRASMNKNNEICVYLERAYVG